MQVDVFYWRQNRISNPCSENRKRRNQFTLQCVHTLKNQQIHGKVRPLNYIDRSSAHEFEQLCKKPRLRRRRELPTNCFQRRRYFRWHEEILKNVHTIAASQIQHTIRNELPRRKDVCLSKSKSFTLIWV